MDRIPVRFPSQKQGGGRPTILVVDDEPLMLRLLEKYFSQHGYFVLLAPDGEQAIELYRSHKSQIDAVLLDIHLPKVAGEEVFRRMKEENATLKVVMASGYLEPQSRTEMTLAGVKHFVNKPYDLNELLGIFNSLLEQKR